MYKKKRNDIDKLKTLFFGKDLRVTEGDAYTEVRKYDFSSYYPEENYIKKQGKPRKNVVDIREYGADVQNSNNAPFINKAIEKASQIGGVVLVDGGDYVTATVNLLSNVTLFIKSKMLILCSIPPHLFHLMLLFSLPKIHPFVLMKQVRDTKAKKLFCMPKTAKTFHLKAAEKLKVTAIFSALSLWQVKITQHRQNI